MSRQEIYDAIPHREPFLWVDEILQRSPTRIVCQRSFRGDEDFFRGHFPGRPLVPGVILCEAAIQSGAILLAGQLGTREGQVPLVTRVSDVRFKRMVRPGESIRIEVELKERLADAFFLAARITVADQLAVRFEFACTARAI